MSELSNDDEIFALDCIYNLGFHGSSPISAKDGVCECLRLEYKAKHKSNDEPNFVYWFSDLAKKCKSYSYNQAYPVIGGSEKYFHHRANNMSMWKGKYGEDRRRLCREVYMLRISEIAIESTK